MIHLTTPISAEGILSLHAGDAVELSGIAFTGRDAAHKYLVVPFLFIYAWGFTGVGLLSLMHYLQQHRWAQTAN